LRIRTSSCVRNSPRRLATIDVFPTGIRVRPWRSFRAPPHSGGNSRARAALPARRGFIPGHEGAGVVAALGGGVTRFKGR
jgi:hypothetical protein